MGRKKQQTEAGKYAGYAARSKQAENHLAESTEQNRNQKGHLPNSPSTG
ncbi:hypothetical protein [Paenibacillus protaetiae]|nr:hypothetical protein [Paenibacillus protaetiae]